MMNTKEVNDLFKEYAEKIAKAWRISDDGEAEWLEIEMKLRLGRPESVSETTSGDDMGRPTSKQKEISTEEVKE